MYIEEKYVQEKLFKKFDWNTDVNLISLWAPKFSRGLLKVLFQGPTWPLENFTKLHPCTYTFKN